MIRFTKAKATPPKPPKPSGEKSAALDRLNAFLNQAEPETVEIFMSNFNAQQNAVTYKELREAYLAGGITQEQFEKWQKNYSKLITGTLAPKWKAAATAAAQEVKNKYPYFVYEPAASAAMAFLKQHGAELVTNLAQEQRQALNAVIRHVSGYTAITPDEAARIIRPCIGLTKPQALANARYREAVKQAYLKAHPRGKPETAERRAADAAARYAARQHRYRAQNIARTELAYAYNAGAYGATKDAQAQGYVGDCVKVWLTAYDERVCPVCSAMDGEKRNMDEPFSNGKLLPPAHPSCRCAVAYEEIPGMNLKPGMADSLDNALQQEPPQSAHTQPESVPAPVPVLPVQQPHRSAVDVTQEYLNDATPNSHIVQDLHSYTVNGVTYTVDGHDVLLDYDLHEKAIAELLERKLGGELFMVPRVNFPQGVRTPDYLFCGIAYDLKTLEKDAGPNTIWNRIKKAKGQAHKFIVDVTKATGLSDEVIQEQMGKIFKHGDTLFVDEIILVRDYEIVKILKRA